VAISFLDISDINLDDVQDRVYKKYEISLSDSKLAIEYLRSFLDAKRRRPGEIIIVPQIVDWAWHEFILDTAYYREVCKKLYGQLMHHVATNTSDYLEELTHNVEITERDLEELNPKVSLPKIGLKYRNLRRAFQDSLVMLNDDYGLRLENQEEYWLDAGWNNPTYKLRDRLETSLSIVDHSEDTYTFTDIQRGYPKLSLSWLPSRIVQRYGVSLNVAKRGVKEYFDFFLSLQSRRKFDAIQSSSELCAIAWEEHILWTKRYEEDCERILGAFLDHTPRTTINNRYNAVTNLAR
jgi:hypothetical protein